MDTKFGRKLTVVFALVVLGMGTTAMAGMSSANYSIPNDVMGAGGSHMSSASYQLDSTLGQPSPLGEASSTSYNNYPGFWQALVCVSCGTTDSDGDGLSDDDEINVYFTNPNDPDTDHDGIGDLMEAVTVVCLDPLADDTDTDNLLDGVEDGNTNGVVDPGETDPCNPDTDADGLTDGLEGNSVGTDPTNWDSDGDAIPDGFEYNHSADADPLNPLLASDADDDFDGDLNPNKHEYYNQTDLWVPDPNTHMGHVDYACAYWGEADGNCVVTSVDRTILQTLLLSSTYSFNNTIPHSSATLDLNGNGSIESNDRTIMQVMLMMIDPGAIGSRPKQIDVFDAPSAAVQVGSTCHVTVQALNNFSSFNAYTSGLAVRFTIDPTSTGSATILGGDGENSGDRYDYTGDAPNATANIVLRIDSPGEIKVVPVIDTCGTPNVGRYINPAVSSPEAPIIITAIP